MILLAVLGLAIPGSMSRTNGIRVVLSALINGVAALIFVLRFSLDWRVVAMLAIGSIAGGWFGARAAIRLPVPAFRTIVVAVGMFTAARLAFG